MKNLIELNKANAWTNIIRIDFVNGYAILYHANGIGTNKVKVEDIVRIY